MGESSVWRSQELMVVSPCPRVWAACPLPGTFTALFKADLEQRERPGTLEEDCFPLGMADDHLGSLCLLGRVSLLEPAFWSSSAYPRQVSEPRLLHL